MSENQLMPGPLSQNFKSLKTKKRFYGVHRVQKNIYAIILPGTKM